MEITAQKRILEKATAILELIEYAEKRILTRENNIKIYSSGIFPGLDRKFLEDNEKTKLAKERLQKYYSNTILKLGQFNNYYNLSSESLNITNSVLLSTASEVKHEIIKERRLFKKGGNGIHVKNIDVLNTKLFEVLRVINTVKTFNNGN